TRNMNERQSEKISQRQTSSVPPPLSAKQQHQANADAEPDQQKSQHYCKPFFANNGCVTEIAPLLSTSRAPQTARSLAKSVRRYPAPNQKVKAAEPLHVINHCRYSRVALRRDQ